jgi:hypothetical protein
MDTQPGFGHVAWTWTVDMHGCLNANKKLSPASIVFLWFTTLNPALAFRHQSVRYRWSRINPLVPSYGHHRSQNNWKPCSDFMMCEGLAKDLKSCNDHPFPVPPPHMEL